MTQDQHPITPPPELVRQWDAECESGNNAEINSTFDALQQFACKAARWGADQELEACCEWLETGPYGFSIEATAPSMTKRLHAARRPKPPSLKEQALKAAQRFYAKGHEDCTDEEVKDDFDAIRRALEQLDD